MIYIYRLFLNLPAVAAFWFGYFVLDSAKSAMHETVGLIGILIGAVFLTGSIIMESIMLLRKELISR
jgi:hypothetical protein